MSDREQITQVAHQKWAKEQIAQFFEQIVHLLMFLVKKNEQLTQKTDEQIPNPACYFPG